MELQPSCRSRWSNTATPSLSREQKHWLYRPGALTSGLRQLGRVQLRVVCEYSDGLYPGEAWMLHRKPQSPVWVREIVMSIDGTDCVVARSFTPLLASHGWWQGIRRLRTRPLADMLYHDREIERSGFWACQLTRQQPLYATVKRSLGDSTPEARALLARCSVFWRQGQPLLVAECFLPSFWALATHCA